MKRLHIESNSPNFIGVWNISNDNLCDNLIKFFEKIYTCKNKVELAEVLILI